MSGKDESTPPKGEMESPASANSTQNVVLPEVVEVLRQEGAHVDVNVLLVQLINKTTDPDAIVSNSKRILEVAQKYEEARVENFKRMADAIIDVKTRDPDELEKRKNNRMRRYLKAIVGGCSLLGLGGGITGIFAGGNMIVVGVLLMAGCIALAMSGPLATGESISSNDFVRIANALRIMLPRPRAVDDDDAESAGSKDPSRPHRKRQIR